MTKVYVKGNDYERGLQLGKLCAAEIKWVFKSYLNYLIKTKTGVPFPFKWASKWAPFLLKPLLFLVFSRRVREQIDKYPAWMEKELEGMAEGSGMHPFYLKFMNSTGSDKKLLGDRDLHHNGAKSCCSFAFTGKDGNIYHGKNLDWIPVEEFIDLYCLQQREDENGNSFSIIGAPGFLNSFEFGMNSHGISIGLTGRFYRGKRAPKQTLTDAVELNILRFAKNFEDIRTIYDTKTGFSRSDGLLIASRADSDYRLFEVTPMGAAATASRGGVLFNTNTYVHPVFHKNNKQWGNIYNGQFCDPRYKRLQQLTAQQPGTLEDAFHLLKDTVQPGFEHKKFLGQATVNRFITHVSALMIQGKNPGVWIARDRTYAAANEYIYFDFSSQPQLEEKKKAADDMIHTETFQIFKEFIHLRESRYYISPRKLIRKAHKLLVKEPENPVFILYLAQVYFKHKQFRQALAVLEKHPIAGLADYFYCLGKCRQELKQYQTAGECFLKAMALPSIDGFPELVQALCLVQLVKVNDTLGLPEETRRWKEKLQTMLACFATPDIGMPDYPYINNIVEQMEQVMM